MKLVIPICKKEAPMVARLAHRFKRFNDMKAHDVVIAPTWEDHFEAQELLEFLIPIFKSAEMVVIPDVPAFVEWPLVGNHVFFETAYGLRKINNNDPWYFFEPDNWPLRPGWLDALQIEYDAVKEKHPFMGAVNVTRRRDPETGEDKIVGKHLVGTAIYPADFFGRSQALHSLTYDPWDVAVADEIMEGVHETPLIFHAWNTGRYQRTVQGVIGIDLGPNSGRYGGMPVPPAAVVIHGCKDDSLARIDFN